MRGTFSDPRDASQSLSLRDVDDEGKELDPEVGLVTKETRRTSLMSLLHEEHPCQRRWPRICRFFPLYLIVALGFLCLIVYLAEHTKRASSLSLILLVIAAFLHWYFAFSLGYRPWKVKKVWQRIILHASIAFVTVPAALSIMITQDVSVPDTKGGAIFCYFMMGFCVNLFTPLVVFELVHLIWFIAHKASKRVPAPADVPIFLRGKALAAILIAVVMSIDGVVGATRNAPVKQVDVTLSRLPPQLDGFRIGMLTDIHFGPTIGRSVMERSVETLNGLNLDVAAIVGDITDTMPEQMAPAAASLANLQARHGKFFVTGNHEYYLPPGGLDGWVTALASLGVRTLMNERVSMPDNSSVSFDLVGVNDWSANHDLAAAVAGRDASRELVLLAHQPKQITEAWKMGVGLQLSGHVHCGQLPPVSLASYIGNPFYSGLNNEGSTQIYVSCGTGYWGPVMRIAAPNEVTLVILHAAS